MEANSIYKKLIQVQKELKAPKSQVNKHYNYHYRNQEDILEAVKPLLDKYGLTLYLSDEVKEIAGRFYVQATANLIDIDSGFEVCTNALAREEDLRKGMDAPQLTGASSSYARKYALNGLFLIDDTKDADFYKNDSEQVKKPVNTTPKPAVSTTTATNNLPMLNVCSECNKPIADNVAEFSKKRFSRVLCMPCQAKESK